MIAKILLVDTPIHDLQSEHAISCANKKVTKSAIKLKGKTKKHHH